jgi:gas vesicle structural protein
MPSDPVVRAPSSSGLADVLDILLDKGLVIDAFVRVSVVGIELLTIDARIVVASVDTYLRFAEAVDRLNLRSQSAALGVDDIVGPGKSLGSGDEETAEEETAEEEPAEER